MSGTFLLGHPVYVIYLVVSRVQHLIISIKKYFVLLEAKRQGDLPNFLPHPPTHTSPPYVIATGCYTEYIYTFAISRARSVI